MFCSAFLAQDDQDDKQHRTANKHHIQK